MSNINDLLKQASKIKIEAIECLIKDGRETFDPVVSELLKQDKVFPYGLMSVIADISENDIDTNALYKLIDNKNYFLKLSLYSNISKRKKDDKWLSNRLLDVETKLFEKKIILNCIGDSKSKLYVQMIKKFLATFSVDEDFDRSLNRNVEKYKKEFSFEHIEVIVSALVALAKIGDQSYSKLVFKFLNADINKGKEKEYQPIRDSAADAIIYIVCSDFLNQIALNLNNYHFESQLSLIRAVGMCGDHNALNFLINNLSNKKIKDKVNNELKRIIGERGFNEIYFDKLVNNQSLNAIFKNGICYFNGEPISLSNVLSEFKKNLQELYFNMKVMTGENFGLLEFVPIEKQSNAYKFIAQFIHENSLKYDLGGFYKYSNKYDLNILYENQETS
ncbi:MAG: hypothetical protein GZ094_15925 [Mariniphaga sp.]|nr:hypothetical protein [Mariniphaga sp.]